MKIKKKLKFIIPGIVILVGIILIIVGFSKGASSDYKKSLNLKDFEAKISSGSIFNIDVDVSIAHLNVISSNEVNDFEIVAEDVTKEFIDYSTTNNTLKLRYNTKKWYQAIFVPGYRDNLGTINLYIPADISLKDVEISAEHGELNVNYLTAERVFIDCGKESNYIKNLTCYYSEINNNGGNLNGINIDSKESDLNLISDTAVLSNFTSESLILKNDGDLNLSGTINGDSSIKSESGDVYIDLFGFKSDYNFKVIDGDVTVNDKQDFDNKDAKYTFEILGDVYFTIS